MKMIDEGRFASIGGIQQWIAVRGSDVANPALFVIGGPGVAMSQMAPFFEAWETHYTLIFWDQPGSGATRAFNVPDATRPLTIERLVSDGAEAIRFVQSNFDIRNIVTMGYSGGSVIGLNLAKKHPNLSCAYIGSGQFIDWAKQDLLGYQLALERAKATMDAPALEELARIGPPPYADSATDAIKSKHVTRLTAAEQAEFAAYTSQSSAMPTGSAVVRNYQPPNMPAQNPRELAMAAYQELRAELLQFRADSLGNRFDVALFFFQGRQDEYAVSSVVEAYAEEIVAPNVVYKAISNGGHSAFFLRKEIKALLDAEVRPLFP